MITPINKIQSLEDIQGGMFQNNKQTSSVNGDFRNVFNEVISNVKESEMALQQEQYLFSTGQSQDTHSLSIASTKAQISVELMTTIRNRGLEAYNELLRTNL